MNCPYCHEDKLGNTKCLIMEKTYTGEPTFIDEQGDPDPDIFEVHIYKRKIYASGNISNKGEMEFCRSINYCPICGRKLEE